MLQEGCGGGARPLSVFQHFFCLLDELVVDVLSSILGLQCNQSSTPISFLTKWGNPCGNIMATNGVLDHIKNRTNIHFIKWIVVQHVRGQIAINRSGLFRVWIAQLTYRGCGIHHSIHPDNVVQGRIAYLYLLGNAQLTIGENCSLPQEVL